MSELKDKEFKNGKAGRGVSALTRLLYCNYNLVHFTKSEIKQLYSINSQKTDGKPCGLWFSVEGNDDGWKYWCNAENFSLDRFDLAYEITLAKEPNIILLYGPADIDNFHYKYAEEKNDYFDGKYINWAKVAADYKGIIIAPYVWSRRLNKKASSWYYGWDCASGCIWDISAIDGIKEIAV